MNSIKNRLSSFNLSSIVLFFLSIITSVLLFFYFTGQTSTKIYVVDNQKLFEQFRMTQEIKVRGEQLLKSQKIKIDSLNVQLALANSELIKSQLYNLILSEQEQIQYFNQNYTDQESAKIWKRIAIYVDDFSQLKQYDLLIGSQKMGDVWYTNPKMDVTEELISYINKKYEGFN